MYLFSAITTKKIDHKDATCTEDGYTTASACAAHLKDSLLAAGHTERSRCSRRVPDRRKTEGKHALKAQETIWGLRCRGKYCEVTERKRPEKGKRRKRPLAKVITAAKTPRAAERQKTERATDDLAERSAGNDPRKEYTATRRRRKSLSREEATARPGKCCRRDTAAIGPPGAEAPRLPDRQPQRVAARPRAVDRVPAAVGKNRQRSRTGPFLHRQTEDRQRWGYRKIQRL